MGFAVIITLLLILIYSSGIFLLGQGLRQLDKDPGNEPDLQSDPKLMEEPVTVLIPFRNENLNLANLAEDLAGQSYAPELLTVLFINDHSDDGSKELIESITRKTPRFECLDLPEGINGKKAALQLAVDRSDTEWIIQVDADCRLGPHFISSHMSFLRRNPSDMVAGMVTTYEGNGSFRENLERLDLLGLIASGGGSFYYGKPIMCSGANLLYSKVLFRETRVFDPTPEVSSGDDMFLMIGARKLGRKLSFTTSIDSLVQTAPAQNLGSMIRQRIRWGSKTPHYGMADIQAVALVVAMTNLLVLCSPVWLIWIPNCWPWILAGWTIKSLADFTILYYVTGYTRQRRSLWWFLPVSISYYFILLVTLVGSLVTRSAWKGRK